MEQLQKSETNLLKLRNTMQIELAKRHCVDCSNNDLMNWVFEELSPKFARLVEENPELLNEFATNPDLKF